MGAIELIPVKEKAEDNPDFINDPLCGETIFMTIDFYTRTGFNPPWICYYAKLDGGLVGSAGFKGKPQNNIVEIAYGTFERYRQHGIGAIICRKLVELSLATDPSVKITARTLPEKNFSTRILEKNEFVFTGVVNDPEDGDVWEWEFKPV